MRESIRIYWLDCLKGIGVILIVFAHLSPSVPIEKFIYSFHVPLFFFISGFLYKPNSKEPILHFVNRKIINYVLPFSFWNALSSAYAIFRGGDLKETLVIFFMLDGRICWNSPIWFLWILLLVEITFFLIEILPFNIELFVTPIIALVLSYTLELVRLPFMLDVIPIGTFFYWFGSFFNNNAFKRLKSHNHITVVCFLFGLTLLLSQLNEKISIMSTYYGLFPICILCGICGVLFMVLSANMLFNNHSSTIFERIGKDSLFIMCIQYPIFTILSSLSRKFLNMDVWHDRSTVKAMAVTVVTFAIIYISMPVFRRLPTKARKVIGIAKS